MTMEKQAEFLKHQHCNDLSRTVQDIIFQYFSTEKLLDQEHISNTYQTTNIFNKFICIHVSLFTS